MQSERTRVVITRKGTDVGKNTDKRVYVTGPHFGTPWKTGTYSSTEDKAQASTFSLEQAEWLVAHKWTGNLPLIEGPGR